MAARRGGATGELLNYAKELNAAMRSLAQHPRTVFVGQAVAYPGTSIFGTLEGVPMERRLELPVTEDMQAGMCIGMSLAGLVPVCIFPRWNFALLAANQIINHMDKIAVYSDGRYRPKVIVRTAVASESPLHPQAQHVGDFSKAFASMCETIRVIRIECPQDIEPAYRAAMEREDSTIVVERIDDYSMES